VFLELGFAQVIVQFASHEWAHLRLESDRSVTGDPNAMARMAGLMRLAMRWYIRAGAVLWVGLSAAGIAFFSLQHHSGVNWLSPWLVVVFATVADFVLLPLWSLLQGANQIQAVNFARFVSGLLLLPVIWGGLLLGAKLWSLAAAEIVGLAWDVFYLWRYRPFFASLRAAPDTASISWRAEIFPVQWRMAVSFVSGYFALFLFTPLIFRINGPVAAGRWGMTWSIASMITAVASTWIYAKTPMFGSLIAKRRYAELDGMARRVTLAALGVSAALSGAAFAVVVLLDTVHSRFSGRLLPVAAAACLFAAAVLMQLSLAQSAYLRAHRAEPFMIVSLLQGAAIVVTTIVLGNIWGPTGVAAGYLGVVAFLVLPLGTRVFVRLRRDWHQPPGPAGLHEDRVAVT
jgi:hypothetical protein